MPMVPVLLMGRVLHPKPPAAKPAAQPAPLAAIKPLHPNFALLDAEGVKWAQEILTKSPLAIRCLKSAFNAELDGQAGEVGDEVEGILDLVHENRRGAEHPLICRKARTGKGRETIMLDADALADGNRDLFREAGAYALNLISSPGSGKTALLEATLGRLARSLRANPLSEGNPGPDGGGADVRSG